MMRKYLLATAVLLAGLAGCTVKETPAPIDDTPFELRNIKSSYYVMTGTEYVLPMRLALIDSAMYHADFTVEATDLPAGATAFSGKMNILSNDSFTYSIKTNISTPGDYGFNIKCSATNRRPQTYHVVMHAAPDCSSGLTGAWAAKDSGQISISPTVTSAYVSSGVSAGTIDVAAGSRTFNCALNCDDGTLTSTGTTSSISYTVSDGNGTFTTNRLVIHYTLQGSTSNYDMWLVLTR